MLERPAEPPSVLTSAARVINPAVPVAVVVHEDGRRQSPLPVESSAIPHETLLRHTKHTTCILAWARGEPALPRRTQSWDISAYLTLNNI